MDFHAVSSNSKYSALEGDSPTYKDVPPTYKDVVRDLTSQQMKEWARKNCTTFAKSPAQCLYIIHWENPGPTTCLSPSKANRLPCSCKVCKLQRALSRVTVKIHHGWSTEHNDDTTRRDLRLAFNSRLGPPANGLPLQQGEFEQDIHPNHDWTRHWGWALELRAFPNHKKAYQSGWFIRIKMLFKDLPHELQNGGISWKNSRRRRKHEQIEYEKDKHPKRGYNWLRNYEFSAPNGSKHRHDCRWIAEVCVQHRDQHWLQRSDFRKFLSADTIFW